MAEPVTKIFQQRMDRAGRLKDLNNRCKELMAETGKSYSTVRWQAMREFGYEGPKEEQALHAEYLASEREKLEEEVLGESLRQQAETAEEKEAREFEQAYQSLPLTASPASEIEWIRSHPAMSRMDRQSDKTKPVKITAEDARHEGGCSQSAVNQLCHWANRPGEFYKQLLQEHRKKIEDEGQSDKRADPSLADVQAYLSQVLPEGSNE